MVQRYEQLFRQLYQKKFTSSQVPSNSYDRVKLLQKKINESLNKKKSKTNLDSRLRQSQSFLEDVNLQAPRRIARPTIDKNKTTISRRTSLPSQRSSYSQFANQSQNNPVSFTVGIAENRSSTHRTKISAACPSGLYHTKQFQIIKRNSPMGSQNSKKTLSKRAVTPSKNVIIGGRNLQDQAELFHKQFKQYQLQIQKHNDLMKLKQTEDMSRIAKKIKQNRFQKQNVSNYRKQNLMIKQAKQIYRKLGKSKSQRQEKQQINELVPWTILTPQYQYY